jgi:hypothetical protein
MFVSLNSYVKKVVSLPVYVNVAQVRAGGFSLGVGVAGVDFWGEDWEGIVVEDVVDTFLLLVFSDLRQLCFDGPTFPSI